MSFVQQIKDKINSADGLRIESPDALVDIHHILMKEYGWIPLDQFKELPMSTIWNLMGCIQKDREREKREMEKSKRKR